MTTWLVAVIAAAAALGGTAWAAGAGYDAWQGQHRAPLLDLLKKTWQPW